MFDSITIGQQTSLTSGLSEGCYFDSNESGLICIYNFSRPTQEEVDAFKASTPGEIRFVRLNGILFILSKLGTLEWVDSPYAPQLSKSMSFPKLEPGKGYSLTFVLVDASTGIVKGLRYVGLGISFSQTLRDEVMFDIDKPIVKPIYNMQIQELYNKYTTKAMVKLSKIRYKIGTAE